MNKLTLGIASTVMLAALITLSTTHYAFAGWDNSGGWDNHNKKKDKHHDNDNHGNKWCGYNKDGSYSHYYNCNKPTVNNNYYVDNSVQRTCEAFCWNWNWVWNTYNNYD